MKYNLGKKNIMNMKSGIYMWTSPSGKSYIGQAVDLDKRKSNFLSFGTRYAGSKINNARRKYNNIQYWTYAILEYCDIDDLDEREEYYISLYNTMRKGYNCESGGNENKIVSDEVKRKLSKAKKGENNPMYGKHLDDETKDKIRLRHNKAVVQYTKEGEFVAEYESALVAKNITGIYSSNISKCCLGKFKSAGGFKWAYKNPPLFNKNEGLNKN